MVCLPLYSILILHMFDILFFCQPILVYMSKVDGRFMFSPISVNFLTEIAKVLFAVVMLILEVYANYFFIA